MPPRGLGRRPGALPGGLPESCRRPSGGRGSPATCSTETFGRGTDERNGQEKQRLWISRSFSKPPTLIPKNTETSNFYGNREVFEKNEGGSLSLEPPCVLCQAPPFIFASRRPALAERSPEGTEKPSRPQRLPRGPREPLNHPYDTWKLTRII